MESKNTVIQSLFDRKSVRAYLDKPIPEDLKDLIIDAGIEAPSAGNQQLYTILDIEDQGIKDALAVICDNQPFIARAPMVLVFLADCRRWQDCYRYAGAEARKPALSDLLLACIDTAAAAQNMVTAAESLGIGSCDLGDIMENREQLVELLHLDTHVFPAAMLVFGYPTAQQKERIKPRRPHRKYLVRKNTYTPLPEAELRALHRDLSPREDFDTYIKAFCKRKYMSDFAREMARSVEEYLKFFLETE
jgi:nitroreductase